MVFFLAVAFTLLRGASAIPWAGPTATPTNKPHPAHEGWSPATTGIAGILGKGYELFKRAGLDTCGYVDGVACKLYRKFLSVWRLTPSQLVQSLAIKLATSALPMTTSALSAAARAPTSMTAP